jgi:hypothetical protein
MGRASMARAKSRDRSFTMGHGLGAKTGTPHAFGNGRRYASAPVTS